MATRQRSGERQRLSERLKYDKAAATVPVPLEEHEKALREAARAREIALADPGTPRPGLSPRGMGFANGS